MAVAEERTHDVSDFNAWSLCRMPFWQTGGGATTGSGGSSQGSSGQRSGAFGQNDGSHPNRPQQHQSSSGGVSSVSTMAKSLLPKKKRLKLDPATKLYFPYEPGKQVKSAIQIKNSSKSHVAFKFQTTSPKSCFMHPPGGMLAPGETIIATVFKFVEPPENNENLLEQKSNVKFKIMSLKVKEPIEYVPELFDEQKELVAVEQILQVVFLNAERPSPQLEKLKNHLAEAEAIMETRKKTSEDNGLKIVGEGLVIDEWKERRERYLARQQAEVVDSL